MDLHIASFYLPASESDHFKFWETGIATALPRAMSTSVTPHPISSDRLCEEYEVPREFYDIAYCQLYAVPKHRPAEYVYTFVSDYYESQLKSWTKLVRPNLVCFLQEVPRDFEAFASDLGIKCAFIPWFVESVPEWNPDRDVSVMCSGCVNHNYPLRRIVSQYVATKKFPKSVVSCSSTFGNYALTTDEYERALASAKYYASGGVFDRLVPPKYFEAAAAGAAIITFDMAKLGELGFEDGVTCCKIRSLEQIDALIESDAWKTVGKNARDLVAARHTVAARARDLLKIIEEG